MRFLLYGLLILTTFSCRRGGEGASSASTNSEYADFEAFYNQFHEDSLYQMAHIAFPLQGLPPDVDSLTLANNNFRWQKDQWVMHRRFDTGNSDYSIELVPMGKEIMIERILHKSGEYGMLRRYAKMDDEWQLIYYVGLNNISRTKGIDISGGF